jgi:hypothetical protein
MGGILSLRIPAVALPSRPGYIGAALALLDALRACTSFTPPAALPECDLEVLAEVLEAHGLAPLASYQVEHTRLGAGLPASFRERLLGNYQGSANDTVLKFVTLRGLLKDASAADLPVVLLDAAAYVDWLYPHLAFRPVGDLRLAVRGEDGRAFAAAVAGAGWKLERTEHAGRVAILSDGRLSAALQEGLWAGAPYDPQLFERAEPRPVFGPRAGRPSAEDALLATVGDQAQLGLHAALLSYVDLRELVRLRPDPGYVKARAEAVGLSRALRGALLAVAWFFPDVADEAAMLSPELSAAERMAVDRVVDGVKDPTRLRVNRGVDALSRRVVAPGV